MLREAVKSDCESVRYGAEFCEWKIPNLETLKEAYSLTVSAKKDFIYVTPRVSTRNLQKIYAHLVFLNGCGENSIVVNDFGVLNFFRQFPNLRPHLGRQLVYTPARCPWNEITEHEDGLITRFKVAEIFYQTNLNYGPTIQFYKELGVDGADVDWIPECNNYYLSIMKNGLHLSVHMFLIPSAVTRRCHTARFLDEKSLDSCTKPCSTRSFLLKHDVLEIELYLLGNTVFKLSQPSLEEMKRLFDNQACEFVAAMNQVTGIENHQEIDSLIKMLRS
jgi:hypothetical protein